ncbi:DUF2530 domain-containing protein [Saccharopolyspora rectivirgula]|uniref:DUF2530 domain-containing protein n=1 Tax=Saccharopolyspora rectivirgula TaxID=28042 RepID=A0A073B0B8_9PSEU|nr:DUF2530 domain-containing protein [Saccharopolyspora rectivirgula]KEI45468.1 hypothetical protein GU90_03225 [Saccharopolyspora rectivirgula]
MASSSDTTSSPDGHRPVPPLPAKLTDPKPVVLVGTLAWLTGAVVFGITEPGSVRFWTCVTGCALGAVGYGLFRWQLSAARRGSRGAWQGLTGLDS